MVVPCKIWWLASVLAFPPMGGALVLDRHGHPGGGGPPTLEEEENGHGADPSDPGSEERGSDEVESTESEAAEPGSSGRTRRSRRARTMAAQNERYVLVPTWSTGPRLLGSDRRIGPAEISTLPKRSAEDMLRLVPGMLIVQHGSQGKGFQIYLRGFDAAHGSDVQVRVDDIPLNERSNVHGHGYLDLAFIIPEVVERVDVQKGAYRLEQGDFATAGTIDYRLGVDEANRGLRTSYEVGTTNRHRLVTVYAPRGQPSTTFAAIEAMTDDAYGQNRRAQRLSAMGQARLWTGPHETEVDAMVAGYAARFGLPGAIRQSDFEAGQVGFYDAYLQDTEGKSFRGLASLRVHGHPGGHVLEGRAYGGYRRLSLNENFTGYLVEPERGDRRLQTHDAYTAGLRFRWAHRPESTLQVRAVLNYQADVFDQAERRIDDAGGIFDTTRVLSGHQHHIATGPGLMWVPKSWARIDVGVRADAFIYGSEDTTRAVWAISPRTTLAFDVARDWSLFGAYGRGLRSPEARAATASNDDNPQVGAFEGFDGGVASVTASDDAEVGLRWSPHEMVEVGATGFGIWIARESVFDHVSGFNVQRNATRRLGTELYVLTRPKPWLLLGVDATYTDGRFVESRNPIPGAPRWMGSVQGSLLHPVGARAGLRWTVLGPRPLAYGAIAGAYTVMDLTVGYRWRFIQFDVAIDNVFATRWREGEYHYASWWDRSQPRSELPAVHYVAGYPLGARFMLTGFF